MPKSPTIAALSGILLVLAGAVTPLQAQDSASSQDSTATSDIRVAIEALRADIAEVRSEVAEVRSEVAELRTDFSDGLKEIEESAPDTSSAVTQNVREAQEQLQGLIWKIFQSLLVVALVFYLVKAISWLLEKLSERDARRRLLFKRLVPVIRILFWVLGVYVIIDVVFEVTQQQIVAASAAVGVAVGFAAQDVLKNVFGGLIIILDKPFQVGDKIAVGGTYGEVVSIGLRATRIQTPDDNLVSVPNAQVVDGQVSNANAGNLDCQVVTNLYLPGWVDVMKAKRIAYEAAANSQFAYLEKPIVVIVQDEFRETFLTHLKVKAYVIDTRFENRFSSDITETAKSEFLREGMLSPLIDLETVTQGHLGEAIDHQSQV